MFIECCSNNIERTEASFFHFVVPFSHRKSCGIVNGIFWKKLFSKNARVHKRSSNLDIF